MKRIHLSCCEHLSKEVTYLPGMAADYLFKPNGLWYAMDNEWQMWCDQNNVESFTRYRYNYELDIDMTNICLLQDVKSVLDFHWKYGFLVEQGNFRAIDWEKVKVDYSGIEIRNYHELSLACSFYTVIWLRNWAVSGGCIWDLRALNSAFKKHIRSEFNSLAI